MRRLLPLLLLAACLAGGGRVHAQYDKDYIFWMGRNFLVDNNYEDAIRTLNILLRVDDGAYEAYFLRGIAKYNLDDLLGAEQDFTAAIRRNPVYTTAYTYRAITRSRLGNYDDALGDFAEAIELRPDLPNPYYSRGVTRLLNQQFHEAIADFDMFIRQEKKVADAYINRGTAYLYLKDTTAAYADYNTAIRTNRENPDGYNRRGALSMAQKEYDKALADFDRAVTCDSSYVLSFFNRAIVNAYMNRPMQSLADFDRTIRLDSTNALPYFNRALVRAQIGDYNRALEDFDRVAARSPGNVLVYFNRAQIRTELGDLQGAAGDYSRAIELYPDFAAAYINRSNLRMALRDTKGARTDRQTAERKIAEYRSRLSESAPSSYADTSQRFDRLLAFDSGFSQSRFDRIASRPSGDNLTLIPLFRFTLQQPDTTVTGPKARHETERVADMIHAMRNPYVALSTRESDLTPDSLVHYDRQLAARIRGGDDSEGALFARGITQSLIKQFTNSVASYTEAIERNPVNPFYYLNRAATRAEMIDFISSIDNAYQRITIENDPVSQLHNASRTYSYDDALADLNKAIKLYPEFAQAYYNRANLEALSGRLPEAYGDYTRAIELEPALAEAYYNRGIVQLFMKDTRKGCLDLSKAGELGIRDAYRLLRRYTDIHP